MKSLQQIHWVTFNFVQKKWSWSKEVGKTRNREPSGNNYVPSFMQVQFLPNYCGLFFISSSKAVIEMLEKNYKIHCSLNNIVRCFYICVEGCICTSIFFFVCQPVYMQLYGGKVGLVVRALAFHQCGPGSITAPGVIRGLSLLVLYSAMRGFPPGTPVFPSHQKPTLDLICRKTVVN